MESVLVWRKSKLAAAVLGCALVGLFGGVAEAGPLGLKPNPAGPDIYVGNNNVVTYNHETNTFSAVVTGGVGEVKPGGTQIDDLDYSLEATIDNAGNFVGGVVSVFGDVGSGKTELVKGNLKKFGFEFGALSTFEFLFEVTGANPLGFGTKGGILLSSFDIFAGDFTSGFSSGNGGMTSSDTYSVPEPASLLLFGLGAAGLAVRRKRLLDRL